MSARTRVTGKRLESICASINQMMGLRIGAHLSWYVVRTPAAFEVWQVRGMRDVALAMGMTASECDRFLAGAETVLSIQARGQ